MNQSPKPFHVLLLLILCLSLLLTGCGKTQQQSSAPAAAPDNSTQTKGDVPSGTQSADSPQAASSSSGMTVEEILDQKEKAEVTVNEVRYVLNDKVESYLLMGIDKNEEAAEADTLLSGGQCDSIMLFVQNHADKTCAMIQFNRDTICDVSTLDPWGQPSHTQKMHLALAHGYGDGLQASCENVIRSLRSLVGDQIPINGYAAINMGALNPINDAIGGVEVTIEDDMTNIDPAFEKGAKVLLQGEQAEGYLRARMSVGDGTNLSRLRRQRTYMNAFQSKFRSMLKEKSNVIDTVYKAAEPYMVTNMSWNQISRAAVSGASYSNQGILTIPGTASIGNTYGDERRFAEFYVDEAGLQELLLKLFYVKAE